MVSQSIQYLIDTANATFEGLPYFSEVKLPSFKNSSVSYHRVSLLWTKDGLRPRWNNLGAVAEDSPNLDQIHLGDLLKELSIPLGILTPKNHYLFLSREKNNEVQTHEVRSENLRSALEKYRKSIFAPSTLARFKTGQLSWADFDDVISEDSFTIFFQHRARLAQALEKAIKEAIKVTPKAEPIEPILMVAIAYLAARILQDKGFFGQSLPINDPKELLEKVVLKTNGFFKKALYEKLPLVSLEAQQRLAIHLGASVTFSLVDHKDVGHLYEQALQVFQELPKSITHNAHMLNLQQYYTPIEIANQMLEFLPLERLRPEERIIFDPAAGSGSLLLAATKRLASMPDVPTEPKERQAYLAKHVIGNDLDPLAELITKLRYSLVQQSYGKTELFPSPGVFWNKDYKTFCKETLPIKPKVIVANPPFAEEKNVQIAADFVNFALTWLSDGDQFAFILPQTFMTGHTHGINHARKSFSERCNFFEIWQLPEGVIGLNAEQPVCVVLGTIGRKNYQYSISRAILSRANKNTICEKGFLGQSWVASLVAKPEDWSVAATPKIKISVPTIPLGSLFDVFNGVSLLSEFPPVSEVPPGVEVKPYWKLNWKEVGRLWADPHRVKEKERYLRYSSKYLERMRLERDKLFDLPKVLVGCVVNRAAKEPLAAHLDTTGFCPNNNVFCICPLNFVTNQTTPLLVGWEDLTRMERLLWLLGILSSELGNELSLNNRSARHITKATLENIPLPLKIDELIIELTAEIINRDQRREIIPNPDPLREKLNQLVEASYGYPKRVKLIRTGVLPELLAWEEERKNLTVSVTGQILEVNVGSGEVYLYLDGIVDEIQEAWVPLPLELPGWALDGTVFTAELSKDIETFDELAKRHWALRTFKHTPKPYLSLEELEAELTNLGK